MEDQAVEPADAPLLFAVKFLIRENRNCISSLQFMFDENRDLFVPVPNDHPVALGIPLPHSLLAPHRQFCDAVRAAIAGIESLVTWKPGLMTLRELYGMRYDRLEECCRIEAILTDLCRYKCVSKFGTGDPFIYTVVTGLALYWWPGRVEWQPLTPYRSYLGLNGTFFGIG